MRMIKLKTTYKVESQSHPGTWYYVNLENKTCSCPEWRFRMAKIGGICKHINFVEERVAKGKMVKEPTVLYKAEKEKRKKAVIRKGKAEVIKEETDKTYAEAVSYVKVRGTVDAVDLIEKYGEDVFDAMIRLGYLLEENGKIRLLE